MINKLLYFFSIIVFGNLISLDAYAGEVFNFDVTEVEIVDEGNIFIGKKGGTATTDDGTIIKANNFNYDKITNILIATGDVVIDDKEENIIIFSQKITYLKDKEFVLTDGESKAVSEDIIINGDKFTYNKIKNILNANGDVKIDNKDENYLIFADDATYLKNEELFLTYGQSKAINEGFLINADNFRYNKITNILNANGNVKMEDTINDYLVFANNATYFKNSEKVITKGNTDALIQSRYDVNSKNVTYLHNERILTSKDKTKIKDEDSSRIYYFNEKFKYYMDQELIKGEKTIIITNYNLPQSDKFFLENAIINLKDKKFIAADTKVKIHKNVLGIKENDPRVVGVSSNGDEDYTFINKGVFTCCEKNDSGPAWSIKATKIKHDKVNQEIIYDNPIIRLFDIPVFYMPKFWHPDPSVKRKSGFLKPEMNSSRVLGTSFTMPYFKVISESKDLTYTPIWYDTDTFFSSVEYRQENKNSKFLADFGAVNNYESYTTKKRNTLSHFFLDYDLDLDLENYNKSNLNLSFQRSSKASYLNVFSQYVTKDNDLRPDNFSKLTNEIELYLTHEKYSFTTGMKIYDTLEEKKSDRYQYIFPYYSFEKGFNQNFIPGNINFNSDGSNNLTETNALVTTINNDITYNSLDYISNLGFKNNFGANYKQVNLIGKKSPTHDSRPKSEIISLYNWDLSLPLIKKDEKTKKNLTPKLSLRVNPSDMKNHSKNNASISPSNIFALNRLSLGGSFEAGRSLTLGLDYRTEKLKTDQEKLEYIELANRKAANTPSWKKNEDAIEQINNYFDFRLATVLRDKEESYIPKKSTINRKNSNLFGSIDTKVSDNIKFGYGFSLDNDFHTFEYNSISTTLSNNNIVTEFNFTEANGERGDESTFSTSMRYNFNDSNYLKFKTRRNRKINFTEYYDLVYEYKNDCLTAGIKYLKTYYSSGDLRPEQNLLFTVTLFPITSYEHDADDLLQNEDSFLNNLELDSRAIISKK